jgi:hypothetical protein
VSRNRVAIFAISLLGALGLFVPSQQVSAGNVSVTDTCTVSTTFTATVPDTVERGKSLTVSNIRVTPSSSYGVTVISATLDMTATNTSSTTYSQSFYQTDPSPTTGASKYTAYYPNWSLDATGPVGSSINVKLKKISAQTQGFGTVTCNLTQTLATIPIVAPAPSPSSSPSPSPTPSTTTPPPAGSTKPSASPSTSSTPTPSATPSPVATPTPTSDAVTTTAEPAEQTVTVVPLNIEVKDSSGKIIASADVTMDGSQKLVTNSKGRVTFSNVLTGRHSVLVLYKGQKVSKSILVNINDIGKAVVVTLPATSTPIGIIAAAAAGTAAVIGIPATMLVIRRRRGNALQPAATDMTIHGIIAGSAVPAQVKRSTVPAPPIQVFTQQPAQPTPAPWDPPANAAPPADDVPHEPPVEPVKSVESAVSEPAPVAVAETETAAVTKSDLPKPHTPISPAASRSGAA